MQSPAGLFVPNGQISFQLNIDATIVASPHGLIPASQVVIFQFDENGDILPNSPAAAAQIYSNQELNPQNSIGLGTYYLVTIYDANGARLNLSPMWWQFTEIANSTVDISEMTPFATVGGNVIFYPTNFTITPPGPTTLGGVFSHVANVHQWLTAINTDGTVSSSQPAAEDLSNGVLGTGAVVLASALSAVVTPGGSDTDIQYNKAGVLFGDSNLTWDYTDQIFSVDGTINATTGYTIGGAATSGHVLRGNGTDFVSAVLAAADLSNGDTGTGLIVLQTSPTLITPVLGVAAGTSLALASAGFLSFNADTGISRASAGVLDVGNGSAGNASGTVNAAQYNIAGSQIAAANLSNGVTGTGAVALAGSPTFTGILTTPTLIESATHTPSSSTDTGTTGQFAWDGSYLYICSATNTWLRVGIATW